MRPFLLLLILPFLSFENAGVFEFNCVILNSETSEPVPYATLGIIKMNIGTNADASGLIAFRINEQTISSNAHWVVSSIGFENKILSHKELVKHNKDTILLTPTTQVLEEVILNRKELNARTVGKKSHGALTHVNIYGVNDSIDDGLSQEFGAILKLRSQCLIDDFNIYFSSNNFENLKLQFLAYSISGDSVKLIPNLEPVFFNANDHGLATVDLKKFDIELKEGEYVFTARIIEKELNDELPRLSIPMATPSPFNGFIFRTKSQENWTFRNSANPSIYLNLSCE
ncbi:MAG: hypothetical protein P8X57_12915 [Cyclobacteriaceae bacterium]